MTYAQIITFMSNICMMDVVGFSKHIHLEEDVDILLEAEVGGDPAWGREE